MALHGINFAYRKRDPLFTDFSLAVPAGEMTALTGPSGCGKSTLLYIIAGLLRPQAGEIFVADTEILRLSDAERSRFRATHTGFVFQDFVLDPRRSILDAVLEPCTYAGLPAADYTERAVELLAGFGVQAPPTATPMEISGGQAQRVALARAVLLEPTVIFADEPTGNLDQGSATTVLDALLGLTAQGTTVIIVTHDDRVTERAHRIVRLDHVA